MARMTPLHLKAASGHRRGVKQLLEDGSFNVDCRTKKGETPLHLASAKGDPLVCERLIKAGADIYARRFDGRTPLHLATAADHAECVQTLLRFGSNPNLEDNQGHRAYDEVRSKEMAEAYMFFFSTVRHNPAIVAHLEQEILNKEFDEITAIGDYDDFSYNEQNAFIPYDSAAHPVPLLPRLSPQSTSPVLTPTNSDLVQRSIHYHTVRPQESFVASNVRRYSPPYPVYNMQMGYPVMAGGNDRYQDRRM